ncbi:MAG: hypothetical protein J5I94_04255 [Phaeodactylibacter sp.]|nr:hypothetical protein [Phaeodactylibacter sp.]
MEEKKGNKKTEISDSKNVIQDANIQAGGNVHIGDTHYHYYQKPPEEVNADLDEIRRLISRNRMEKAMEGLWAIAKAKDRHDEVEMLTNQWEELQKQSRLGLVSYDQSATRRNQIIHGLLQIVKGLEKE